MMLKFKLDIIKLIYNNHADVLFVKSNQYNIDFNSIITLNNLVNQ